MTKKVWWTVKVVNVSLIVIAWTAFFSYRRLGSPGGWHPTGYVRSAQELIRLQATGNTTENIQKEIATTTHTTTEADDSMCGPAKLLPNGNLTLTALHSFPGSGNTWMRFLIEGATGIQKTGSVYCDRRLRDGGFKGECEDAECRCTVVVKVHLLTRAEYVDIPWERGIHLMRNPFDTIMAEWTRKHSDGHTGEARKKIFRGEDWRKYIKKAADRWAAYYDDAERVFGAGFQQNLLVVHYEHLKFDLRRQLRRIIDFLAMNSATITPERNLCALRDSEGQFKRNKTTLRTLDPYTSDERSLIDSKIRYVLQKLGRANRILPPYANEYL